MIEIVIRDGGQDFTYEVSKETADAIEAICEADNAGFERDQQMRKKQLIIKLKSKKIESHVPSPPLSIHERDYNEGIETAIKAIKEEK